MASILVKNLCIDFPVYDQADLSFKKRVFSVFSKKREKKNGEALNLKRSLHDCCFEVKAGERVALLGDNGAGKTTLLRVLNGIYKPTSGECYISGSRASLVDISLGIDPEASGRENIYLRGRLLGMSRSDIYARSEEIIEFSELSGEIDVPFKNYSSGMQLRLAFAISTTVCPNILLMDEWLSVGDEKFRKKAEDRISNLVRSSEILVVATHSRELVERNCTRALLIENGRVKLDASPAEVCAVYFEAS